MKTMCAILLLANMVAFAQTAPPVTGIQAIQHNGQTFVTWSDAATGQSGATYRYDLYRSTSGPITNLASAALVQKGIYNNSGQLLGPKPYNQGVRQQTNTAYGAYPMVTMQSGGAQLPLWSGVAVYTNLATATAYYAVITRDITGATGNSPIVSGSNALATGVSEAPATLVPILQIPGTDPSRNLGCSNCNVTSASVGRPLWLKLHASGGSAASWGDEWAYWGNSNMGFEDGAQSIFAVYQDTTGTAFNSGFKNQLIVAPQDAVWSEAAGGTSTSSCELACNAQSETYWFGYNGIAVFPNAYVPGTDTGAHVFPFTQAKLSLILPWAVNHYQSDPNRIFGHGISMGGYGMSTWALRQPNTFAGIFMGIPIIGPWQKTPQNDYGAALGTVSVTNGSPVVTWSSGYNFGKYLAGPTTIFNLALNGIVKTVSAVNSATQLTLTHAWTGASGTYPYLTGPGGAGCDGIPDCGAGLTTIATTVDTLPDGVTTYNSVTDTPTWVSHNCALTVPYVSWSAGRLDTTTAGMWNMSVLMANALAACRDGFSFAWANDDHNSATAALENALQGQYAEQLRLNVSYPAFTAFSLDSNYGNGNPSNGDCTTGNALDGPVCYVNYGWAWTVPTETATSWSATFSNSQITSGNCPTNNCATTATVNVTVRNPQVFKPPVGTTVRWSATGGQSGSTSVDGNGLITVVGLNLNIGKTTLKFTTP